MASSFYAEGVHNVGVDRIIAEAGVAKATFYHHFPTKDALVVAYVEEQSRLQCAAAENASAPAGTDGRRAIQDYFAFLCDAGAAPGYRSCPIVNIAVEFPDPSHPVRRGVEEHRRWFRRHFRALLAGDGHPDPDCAADALVLLRDGVLIGLDLDDPAGVHRSTGHALDALLPLE